MSLKTSSATSISPWALLSMSVILSFMIAIP
jgi:hypothetical protein